MSDCHGFTMSDASDTTFTGCRVASGCNCGGRDCPGQIMHPVPDHLPPAPGNLPGLS